MRANARFDDTAPPCLNRVSSQLRHQRARARNRGRDARDRGVQCAAPHFHIPPFVYFMSYLQWRRRLRADNLCRTLPPWMFTVRSCNAVSCTAPDLLLALPSRPRLCVSRVRAAARAARCSSNAGVVRSLAHVNTRVCLDVDPAAAQAAGALVTTLHSWTRDRRPLRIFILRASAGFEPIIGSGVAQPLAALLRACLAVNPSARPTAEEARVEMASLAAPAEAWLRCPISGGDALPPALSHAGAADPPTTETCHLETTERELGGLR